MAQEVRNEDMELIVEQNSSSIDGGLHTSKTQDVVFFALQHVLLRLSIPRLAKLTKISRIRKKMTAGSDESLFAGWSI